MPITPNIRNKGKALMDAIQADAPNLYAKLNLMLAKLNAARAGAGNPALTLPELVLNSLVESGLAEDWQRRRQELEALKTQEAQEQLEVEIQALKDAL